MTTLLAVDDSSTMRKVLDITFAGEDFTPVLAGSVQEALNSLQESHAPIALVDITLGDDSGYDLCQQIKSSVPGTKVLLLSSKQNPYDNARGSSVGADDHLDKPFDTQTLIDKVKTLAAAAQSQPAPVSVQPTPASVQPAPASVQPVAAPLPLSASPSEPAAPTPALAPVTAYESPDLEPPQPVVSQQPPSSAPPAGASAPGAASFETRLLGLGLTADQVQGVLALSKDVVEQAVWEVVPAMAEALIREEIQKLTLER